MPQIRQERIELALKKRYPRLRATTIAQFASALIFTEGEKRRGVNWIPTWRFRKRGVTPYALTKMYDFGLLDVRPPTSKPVYCQRTKSLIWSPTEKDAAFIVELEILLDHAEADPKVRDIVMTELDISTASTIEEIRRDFSSRSRRDRLRAYDRIRKRIEEERRQDPRFIHMKLHYVWVCNRWALLPPADSILKSVP